MFGDPMGFNEDVDERERNEDGSFVDDGEEFDADDDSGDEDFDDEDDLDEEE